ncbi:hypothetical protein [Anaeromyxobacter oryzae]|uniref:Tetratricopeptide repeat protein n=1 Tax=Anaeromyxobacter oryzae TaxID=2918170 RepID=A0ABN6MSF7_9BACT|nr:hypothetical protein [Anaeromyxobacter oryzae]BDG03924.1 hypothetical protein AMOR_29200 [Anaeromyxobacter oryzae]
MIPLTMLAALLATAAPAADAAVAATALPALDGGGPEELQPRDARASVLVFFRPDHERSQAMLADVARCQQRLAGKPVRWVGVVPDGAAPASARADVDRAGARLVLAVDRGDAVYGALGLRMHPVVVVLGRGRTVAGVEPFHAVDACDLVTVRIRRALGEATDADVAHAAAPERSALPGDGDQTLVARRNLHLGEKLLAARSYAKAHDQARRALAVAPIADAWALEGEIFAAEGKCPDARRAFEAALALDPRHARAAAGRGRCP